MYIILDVYILQNVHKKASWFHHAQGAGGGIVLFLIYARRGRQASHPYGQRLFSLPAPPRLAHNPYNVTVSPFAPMLENRGQKLRF